MARDPEAAVADAELDVVAPVGGDVEAGGNEADEEADNQQDEPGLNRVVELVPEPRVTCGAVGEGAGRGGYMKRMRGVWLRIIRFILRRYLGRRQL